MYKSEYNISEQQRNKFFEDIWNIKFEDAGKDAIKYYSLSGKKKEKFRPHLKHNLLEKLIFKLQI